MSTTNRLVNDTPELKSGMGAVQTDLVFKAVESFVDDAEQNHIIPAIGYGLYDALRETTGLSAEQLRAKTMLQKAIANFAIHYYVAFGAVQIGEGGIFVLKTDRILPASDKKTFQLRTQARADGFRALEAAINYLEANRTAFPQYISDTAHALNRRFFVNTTAEFSLGYDLQNNAEVFASLKTVMSMVEENHIEPLLGSTLSEALRAAILDNSTTTQQKKLLAKIAKPVALLSIAEAALHRLVNLEPNGLVTATIKSGTENIENSTEGDLERIAASVRVLQSRGMSEVGKLTKWLNDNATDYPGYEVQNLNARAEINNDLKSTYLL